MNKIDVIIPAYNAEKFIKAAIDSALSQTLLPQTIIVVDDKSSDNTAKLVKSIQAKNPIVKYIKLQSNRGASAARNEGIKNSSSDFIALLDADDMWTSDKLEKQFEVFDKSPLKENLAIVYSNCQDIDEFSNPVITNNPFTLKTNVKGKVLHHLRMANVISGSCSSVLIRRKFLNEIGLFDEQLEACEDWDLWLRFSHKFLFDYVEESQVFIRRHSGNSQKNFYRMLSGHLKFYSKIFLLHDLNFYRLMGFRAWIFRSFCPATNIYQFFKYAINPYKAVVIIKINLERLDTWNKTCNEDFKRELIRFHPFLILIWFLFLSYFFKTIFVKMSKFFSPKRLF